MDASRVTVRIYGQEYVITGDKSREYILKVADHVDEKMYDIGQSLKTLPVSSLAVLAAVDIADEYFSGQNEVTELKEKTDSLERDVRRYEQLWEEAKRSLTTHREEAQNVENNRNEIALQLEEFKKKCKELESGFFDLQMENIQLKSEVDKLRRLSDLGTNTR